MIRASFILFFLATPLAAQNNIEDFYDSSGIKRQIRGHFNPDVQRNHTEWAPSIVEFVFSKTENIDAIVEVIEEDLNLMLDQYPDLVEPTRPSSIQIRELKKTFSLNNSDLAELGLIELDEDGEFQTLELSEFERRFIPLWLAFNQELEKREQKADESRRAWTIAAASLGAVIGAGIGVRLQLKRGHLKNRKWIVRSVAYAAIGAGVCGGVYRMAINPRPDSVRLEYRSPNLPAVNPDPSP